MPRPGSRRLYRIAIGVAAASFAMGFWRVFVERNVRHGVFWQLTFPLIVLFLALLLYRRSFRS